MTGSFGTAPPPPTLPAIPELEQQHSNKSEPEGSSNLSGTFVS